MVIVGLGTDTNYNEWSEPLLLVIFPTRILASFLGKILGVYHFGIDLMEKIGQRLSLLKNCIFIFTEVGLLSSSGRSKIVIFSNLKFKTLNNDGIWDWTTTWMELFGRRRAMQLHWTSMTRSFCLLARSSLKPIFVVCCHSLHFCGLMFFVCSCFLSFSSQ